MKTISPFQKIFSFTYKAKFDDGLVENEEVSKELSLIAKMTMLSKTTEILGQVLKNQYSKIERVRKTEIISASGFFSKKT